jgi:hypothetical protein
MKIRLPVVLFVFTTILLIAAMLWYGLNRSARMRIPATTSTTSESAATMTLQRARNALGNAVPMVPATQDVGSGTPQGKGTQVNQGLTELNDMPIAFYGKLEDQFGKPVVGGQIAASVRVYNALQSTVERFSVTSDENGFFQVSHGKGESLSVIPSKAGYVLATKDTTFKYSYLYADHFTPNPNRPTVIKMWKLQGEEPLVSFNRTCKLNYTNTPVCFDLVAGKIVPIGGDVKVSLDRPAGDISERSPQKWGVEIAVLKGGFIEASDADWSVTYSAPEGGYQSDGRFDNNNGVCGFDKAFFIECRNGQVYSKFSVSIGINNKVADSVYFHFSGVANTNSSRNWEATVQR